MSEVGLKQEAEIKGKRGLRLKFSLSTAILVSMVLGIITVLSHALVKVAGFVVRLTPSACSQSPPVPSAP